jgi:hypothetical protein
VGSSPTFRISYRAVVIAFFLHQPAAVRGLDYNALRRATLDLFGLG